MRRKYREVLHPAGLVSGKSRSMMSSDGRMRWYKLYIRGFTSCLCLKKDEWALVDRRKANARGATGGECDLNGAGFSRDRSNSQPAEHFSPFLFVE